LLRGLPQKEGSLGSENARALANADEVNRMRRLMSAYGHKADMLLAFRHVRFRGKADIGWRCRDVRFWHKADMPTGSINVRFWG
jgi:hypothetical protein